MNETLRNSKVLIAGFGSIGRRHFQNLRALGFHDFVFHRTNLGTIEDEAIRQWPAFSNLTDALACKPTLAIIANPTALHIPTAILAAQANCHLLIEKPLSHDIEGSATLLSIVRERGLTAMLGCQFRFHYLLNRLRDEVAARRIGEIFGARAEWGEHLPGWHPWEDYRKSYSSRKDLGGGVILTLIHPIDYLYWLFGGVSRVQCVVRSLDYLQTQANEDWADLNVQFVSGVAAQIHLDYHQRPPVHTLSVWGQTGRAFCDFQCGTLTWTDVTGNAITESVPAGFERNTMFVNELLHFVDCIKGNKQPLVPLQDGIAVLRIALEAKQQARTGALDVFTDAG